MTKVPRRPVAPAPKPWPTQAEPEGRVTTEGKVSGLPSPVQAMWAEAIGRVHAGDPDGASGLYVALSILTCLTLEEVQAEVARRARTSVSGSRRRSL